MISLFLTILIASFYFLPQALSAMDEAKVGRTFADLSSDEKTLLLEFKKSIPLLVKKYSQLSIEYEKIPHGNNRQRREIFRIFLREGGYYRWDVETDKEIMIHLALPERCYRFGKKKGADEYSLISKGGSEESKNTVLMIMSSEVVRAPFAIDALPIWYEYDILDDPLLDRSSLELFERTSQPKYVSIKQSSGSDGEKNVMIIMETGEDEEQLYFPEVFIRNRNWALKSSRSYVVDDSGKKFYIDYNRIYNGEFAGIPLLKQVSNLTFSRDNNELVWNNTFLVSKIELSPPPLSVFDPKQFLPSNKVKIQQKPISVGRIILTITGIVLILWGLWLKLKSKKFP
jgi:hypothetical protein